MKMTKGKNSKDDDDKRDAEERPWRPGTVKRPIPRREVGKSSGGRGVGEKRSNE